MPISDRVMECITKYNADDLSNSLIQICIAIDGTAKKEYPKIKKVGKRFKIFIRDNQDIITFFTFNKNFFIDCQFGEFTIEQFIYKILRCGLLHEGDIPTMLEFVTPGEPTTIGNRKWRLPKTFIFGTLLAVIGASSNTTQTLPGDMEVTIIGQTFKVNELWGHADAIRNLIQSPLHNQADNDCIIADNKEPPNSLDEMPQ
jgi:hypothetical protein